MLVLIMMLSGFNLMVTRSDHVWCTADQVTIKVGVFFIVNLEQIVIMVLCDLLAIKVVPLQLTS